MSILGNGRPRRVLAVGAHPDDIEILCAGTLARCRENGDTIVICVATNGDMGSMTHQPPELAKIREAEARASAAHLDAEFHWLAYTDEFLYPDHDTRMRYAIIRVNARLLERRDEDP